MMRSITARELQDWEYFFRVEPRGSRRADYRTAQILQLLIEINKDHKKSPTPVKLEELLLKFEEKKKQTWQEQKAMFLEYALASNSTELAKQERKSKRAKRV